MTSLDATDIHSLPINPSLGNVDNTPNIILHKMKGLIILLRKLHTAERMK